MYLYILQKERIIKYKKITNNTNNKNEKNIIFDKQITKMSTCCLYIVHPTSKNRLIRIFFLTSTDYTDMDKLLLPVDLVWISLTVYDVPVH